MNNKTNIMNNIPTAEELAATIYQPIGMTCNEFAIELAIKFAKLHLDAQAKAICEKVTTGMLIVPIFDEYQKEIILNAYPKTNIK